MQPLDLSSTYLALGADGAVAPIEVTPTFWDEVMAGGHPEMDGTTVGVYDYAGDWSWERHPAGDEVVVLLQGAVTFVLEQAGGEQRVGLAPGQAVVVPAGVWHRAEVPAPSRALHITPGSGTEHRPV